MSVRHLILFSLSVFLTMGCVSHAPVDIAKGDPANYFQGLDGCFLLYDVKKGSFEKVYNEKRCRKELPACSTFKVPLAVMGFDSGILKDEETFFHWDGEKHQIESWNKDQTAASWMKDSVVWVSQILAKEMGREKVQKYLNDFQYGNKDFTGGLQDAWLTSAYFLKKRPKTSVKISAYEQVEFMKKLWSNALPASQNAQELTRKITFIEKSPNGYRLHGKTGSGFEGPQNDWRIGWFVSHLEGNGREYIAVAGFTDKNPAMKKKFAGMQSREITKSIFKDAGLW